MRAFAGFAWLCAALMLPLAAPALAAGGPLVVIDAGHGGHDPGAISVLDEQQEKVATLAVAKLVRSQLSGSGIRVVLTRDDDRFLPLVERRHVAEAKGASLFLSLHADSAGSASACGATAYTLSEGGTQIVSARLSRRMPALGDPELSALLGELGQRAALNSAGDFAEDLQAAFGTGIRTRDRFHLPAEFAVLKAMGVPAVLLEMGYVTSESDAAQLFSRDGQLRIAKAIASAIRAHFAVDEDFDRSETASADF